jgi:IQ calmodulin-binding motif
MHLKNYLYIFDPNLLSVIIAKTQANRVPTKLAIDYLIAKVIIIQSFWRMIIAKSMLSMVKKSGRILLVTGPARLTRASRLKGSFTPNTRYIAWLKIDPPALLFVVNKYSADKPKAWRTSVNLSELTLVKTKCRLTLQSMEVSTAKQYLQSLILANGELYFEMNKKVDILFNSFLSEDLLCNLDLSLEEEVKSRPNRQTSTSTSKSRLGSNISEKGSSLSKIKSNDSIRHIRRFESSIMKRVLTIQRYIRGFVTRLNYRRLREVSSVVKLTKEFIQEGEVV